MRLKRALAPRERARVVQKIVTDAELPAAEGLPADARSLGSSGFRGDLDCAQPRDVVAATGGKAQQTAVRIHEEHGDRHEVPARKPGVADLLVQLVGRFRVEDRFIYGAQRRKGARECRRHDLNSPGISAFFSRVTL
ncbi:hypothetical protein ACVWWK_002735 [Bradyrhizobium sp. LB9.1b]